MSNGRKLFSLAPWVAVVVMAVLNVLLLRQNLQMRRMIDASKPAQLNVGEKVPPIIGRDLNGQPVSVTYTGIEGTRVLLYFTPSCGYCSEQFPYWRQVIKNAEPSKLEVIGILADTEDRSGVADYLRSVDCQDLPVILVPKSLFKDYKLVSTPTTLVIGSDGRVRRAWLGEWNPSMLAAAVAEFGFPISGP